MRRGPQLFAEHARIDFLPAVHSRQRYVTYSRVSTLFATVLHELGDAHFGLQEFAPLVRGTARRWIGWRRQKNGVRVGAPATDGLRMLTGSSANPRKIYFITPYNVHMLMLSSTFNKRSITLTATSTACEMDSQHVAQFAAQRLPRIFDQLRDCALAKLRYVRYRTE